MGAAQIEDQLVTAVRVRVWLPSPSLHSFSRSDDGACAYFISGALDPNRSPGELSRAAPRDQAGRLSIHPRFRFGTCLRLPSGGPSPFGKDIVCAIRKRALFN